MSKKIFIIFPTQLFEKLSNEIKAADVIFIVEDSIYFTKYKFHKLKLIFHRASMKYYQQYLQKLGKKVVYYEFTDKYILDLKNSNVFFYDPVDRNIIKKINDNSRRYHYSVNMLETPAFITTHKDLTTYDKEHKGKKFMHDASFYKWQRNRLQILTPIGSGGYLLSYDKENRLPFPKNQVDIFVPQAHTGAVPQAHTGAVPQAHTATIVTEAKQYVNKHFAKNWGNVDHFIYPIDHAGAKKWLQSFIKDRLSQFGKYEDAFSSGVKFGYHSVLSPLLNIGLLTDADILAAILSKKTPIESLEGYIRQLIGWKQSMRYLYEFHFAKFYGKNFLKHTRKISKRFWDATTGMPPVDDCINKARDYGYLHHIERLMIMGQFFLLTMVNPKDVYDWFISVVSMDSYEWVMVPNIYGMIMYADGGFMMSRPYFSSSAYIKKMSGGGYRGTIKLGDGVEYQWDDIWDALYYNLIFKHRVVFKKIYATARNVYHWDNKSAAEKKRLLKLAGLYLAYL